MNKNLKTALIILAAGIWISVSEFLRNELLFKSYWLEHYAKIGIEFPSAPVNGAIWGIWSFCLAFLIYFISRKFNYLQTVLIAWFASFMMMWLAIGNLSVLPFSLLIFAIPLSIIEVLLATLILKRSK